MIKEIDYNEAIKKMATYDERMTMEVGINMFDMSLLISDLFEVTKHKALNDLTRVRLNQMEKNKNKNAPGWL